MTSWLTDLAPVGGEWPVLLTDDGVTTYRRLVARSAELAAGLHALGVGRGDRVASFLPNGATAIELFFAVARLGAVAIGVNTRYRADDRPPQAGRPRPRQPRPPCRPRRPVVHRRAR